MAKNQTAKRSRVLIVDDHPAVRDALALRIGGERDLEVCGEAADAGDALQLVVERCPDVAVVDISLKSGSGIDLVQRIRDRDARVRILVCSMHSESLYAARALRAGALGYITKDQETARIIEAIRRVLEGKIWLSEAMSDTILHRAAGATPLGVARSPLETLANRELDVFRLIGEGVRTTDIAERLHLSVKTVETYRDRIRHKLGLQHGTELVHVATQWVLENR